MTRIVILLLLLLSGCASMPSDTAGNQSMSWDARSAMLAKLSSWQLSGKIGFNDGRKGTNARVKWQQKTNQYRIDLYGPFGAGATRLSGKPGAVTLMMDNKVKGRAASPEALFAKHLKWAFPVSHLYYWVRGLPAPGSEARTQFDQYNHLKSLQQAGWRIDYGAYQRLANLDVPKVMTLTKPPVKIRVVIARWMA